MAALVTLVTINAVVDVSRHIVVMEIGGVVSAVTACALEHGIVTRVCMARRANATGVAMRGRELRVLRVIECGVRPGCRGVASRTRSRREERGVLRRRVGRIGRVVVIRLMAADTRGRQRGVVAVDVTVRARARRNCVLAG